MDQTQIDALRAQPVPAFSHLIDGKHVAASDGGTMDIMSPIDGQVFTTTAKGTVADMQAAITSARAAFEDGRWAGQSPAARKKVLMKWADLIEANALELAVLGVRDNGTEINMAIKAEPGSAAGTIRYYAEALDKIYGEIAPTSSDVLGHDPQGTSWRRWRNHPVEFPDDDWRMETGSCVGNGQFGCTKTG